MIIFRKNILLFSSTVLIGFSRAEGQEDCKPGPPGCPPRKIFYDDFSNGFDPSKWLKVHRTWGSAKDGSYTNGGVVFDNIDFDDAANKVVFEAHGNDYTGDVMGVEKGPNDSIVRRNTGVRTGAAIASREYFGAGSYEVRMKVAGDLGVCTAIWTYFYSDEDYYADPKVGPITNHEIDIELPGRPAEGLDNIGFNKALMNTWVSEGDYHTGYTQLDDYMNDDLFHTWRFDWHTGTGDDGSDSDSDPRVDFFVDGKLYTTNRDHVPFIAGRLWLGAWFPNKWAGTANFVSSQMEVDYVSFTPFEDEVYECPEESYPTYGFAPDTDFSLPGDDPVECSSVPTSIPSAAPSSGPSENTVNGCYQVVGDKFSFFRKNGVESSKACKWLARRSDRRINEICGETRSGEFGPAQDICKVTCGTCPNGCGEINKDKFYLKANKRRGAPVYKKCDWLQDLDSSSRVKSICEKTPPTGEKSASSVCKVTCDMCGK